MQSDHATAPDDGACLMCGSRGRNLLARTEDKEYHCKPGQWDIVECNRCGHVYVHPLPRIEEVPSLYPTTYYTVNPKSALFHEGGMYAKKLRMDARKLHKKLAHCALKDLIDIGCGDVRRLAAFRDAFSTDSRRATATAFDILFSDDTRHAGEELGIQCRVGNIESDVSSLPDQAYDLAFMRQLIEHLRDPRQALINLRPKLRPGALLVIDTPNLGGLDYKFFRKSYWGGFHTPRHFHLFTQPSLRRLVEQAGFKVVEQGYLPSIGFWIISARVRLGLDCVEKTKSIWEFVSLKNIPVAAAFTIADMAWIKLGQQTSNQYLIAEVPR